ncbi:hypothetical protein, partial [Pseudomonas sp. S4_EA_1b]|uniref:hypothetical protein n=1 Tax=Pseudomonas sp. S4_EA_1b TaxID=2796960 RepID=UPI001E33D39C
RLVAANFLKIPPYQRTKNYGTQRTRTSKNHLFTQQLLIDRELIENLRNQRITNLHKQSINTTTKSYSFIFITQHLRYCAH